MLDDSPLQEADRRSPRTFRQRQSATKWWPSSGRLGKQISPGREPFELRHHGPGDVGSRILDLSGLDPECAVGSWPRSPVTVTSRWPSWQRR